MKKLDFLKLELTINDVVLFDFNGIVTQNTIVSISKAIRAILIESVEEEARVRTIFALIIEIMQNILSYSADSVDLGNNRCKSRGAVLISHSSGDNFYKIHSGNYILKEQQKPLEENLNRVNAIAIEDIKEAYKHQRRSGKKVHSRGAGLGFFDMVRKSKNKLAYRFHKSDENNRIYFELDVKVKGAKKL